MKTNRESKRLVKDLKYNIMKHPNVVLTAEGRAGMYPHGLEAVAKNTIQLSPGILPKADIREDTEGDWLIMSEEDVHICKGGMQIWERK